MEKLDRYNYLSQFADFHDSRTASLKIKIDDPCWYQLLIIYALFNFHHTLGVRLSQHADYDARSFDGVAPSKISRIHGYGLLEAAVHKLRHAREDSAIENDVYEPDDKENEETFSQTVKMDDKEDEETFFKTVKTILTHVFDRKSKHFSRSKALALAPSFCDHIRTCDLNHEAAKGLGKRFLRLRRMSHQGNGPSDDFPGT